MSDQKLKFTVNERAGEPDKYCIRISIEEGISKVLVPAYNVMHYGRFDTTQDAEDFLKLLIDNLTVTLSTGNPPTT